MSTKSGRRSSIRELKPGASKKRGRGIETKAVAEAAVASDPLEVEATEKAPLDEPSSSDAPESTPPEPASSEDEAAASGAGAAAVTSDDAEAEPVAPEPSDDAVAELADDDVEPTTIEAAMLAELSEGVTDNTEAFLEGLIEALLFSSDRPMPAKELARSAGIDRKRAEELVAALKRRYDTGGLTIEEVAGGYVMRSSPRYASYIQKLLALRPVRLSRAQLETLAIVAYRQPVTKPEVDDIRGVDSGQVLKGLLERELLKIVGKKDEPGRPMLYGTTTAFLELLNLQSLKDLPTLREFTELSEESRRKFAEETGESPEVAPGGDAATAAGQGEAPAGATLEPTAGTHEGETPSERNEADTHESETPSESSESESPAAVEAAPSGAVVAVEEADATGDVDEAASATDADEASSAEQGEAASDTDEAEHQLPRTAAQADDEEGIDLDMLADLGELEDDEPPASRG